MTVSHRCERRSSSAVHSAPEGLELHLAVPAHRPSAGMGRASSVMSRGYDGPAQRLTGSAAPRRPPLEAALVSSSLLHGAGARRRSRCVSVVARGLAEVRRQPQARRPDRSAPITIFAHDAAVLVGTGGWARRQLRLVPDGSWRSSVMVCRSLRGRRPAVGGTSRSVQSGSRPTAGLARATTASQSRSGGRRRPGPTTGQAPPVRLASSFGGPRAAPPRPIQRRRVEGLDHRRGPRRGDAGWPYGADHLERGEPGVGRRHERRTRGPLPGGGPRRRRPPDRDCDAVVARARPAVGQRATGERARSDSCHPRLGGGDAGSDSTMTDERYEPSGTGDPTSPPPAPTRTAASCARSWTDRSGRRACGCRRTSASPRATTLTHRSPSSPPRRPTTTDAGRPRAALWGRRAR